MMIISLYSSYSLKKWGVYLFFWLFPISMVTAQPDTLHQYFKTANQYYKKQKYQEALKTYQQIENTTYTSAALYYNMGNVYYKVDSIAQAILYYERALRLAPNDEAIQHNLKKARQETVDKIEPLPQIFILRWWNQLARFFSPIGWAIIGVISLWVGLGFATFFLLTRSYTQRKIAFFMGLFVFVISIFSVILAQKQYHYQNRSDKAIIFSPSLYVKYGPDPNSTNKFVLHKGTKVIIKDQVDNWVKIRLADGQKGWMKKEQLRII